jgi:uroporphyrinogen decarboxylase
MRRGALELAMADQQRNSLPSFEGLGVACFESRRAEEISKLVSKFGGIPHVGPSMREVPLADNAPAFAFAERLLEGEIDGIVFMTGVGTRALIEALETRYAREEILHGIASATVVARGPKPAKVLREFGVHVTILVPEPNTWREILQELEENPRGFTLKGSRIAIQEYGEPNEAFIAELEKRGAQVVRVPVYRWSLPEDLEPLKKTIDAVMEGRARIVLFTNAVQVNHVMRVAAENGKAAGLLDALRKAVVCSVGPTCTEALVGHGIAVDIEPSPPKMGVLIAEAAKRAAEILRRKERGKGPGGKAGVSNGPAPAGGSFHALGELKAAAAAAPWADSRFMKACRRELADATPVWLMRQAGRYLKDYRELRARVPFLELCKNPALAAEVTVSAVQKLGVDAAIIFADLLLIVEPLGFELEYDKGEGPVIKPVLREPRDVERLHEVEPRESLDYLYQAIRLARAGLDARIPLIGFAGAPFTLASYLIEGGASKSFRHTKTLMYRDAGAWRELMDRLAEDLAKYVNGQIAAGVQAMQIFDTWAGCLGPADYREFVMPYTRKLIRAITPGTPVIHFGVGTGEFLEEMRRAGGDVIGLDFRVELDNAWRRVGYDVGVQGNLDPLVLYGDLKFIRARTQRILDQAAERPGHIFNLGHGVLPETPEENVRALTEMVHELSSRSGRLQ